MIDEKKAEHLWQLVNHNVDYARDLLKTVSYDNVHDAIYSLKLARRRLAELEGINEHHLSSDQVGMT